MDDMFNVQMLAINAAEFPHINSERVVVWLVDLLYA